MKGNSSSNEALQSVMSKPVEYLSQTNVLFRYRPVWLAVFVAINLPLQIIAQNVLIIESQSNNTGHVMDIVWQSTASNMGLTATIGAQSELLDTNFFAGTDALIISSGVIILSNAQINTITEFMKSGKSIYLQGEYDCSIYNTNTLFESLVNNNGGVFDLNGTIAGTLAPMNVMGALASTPNAVSPLSYFWYGCRGNACANVEPFLEYNNDYFGFIFCPPNSDYGRVVYTTDQDWVNQSTSIPLLKNILTLITENTYQCSGQSFFSVDLGADTTICEDSTYVLNGGPAGFSHLWSTGATGGSITVDAAGVYWVTISNGSCSVSDTVVITEVPCNTSAVSFNASDTVLCEKFCINFFDNSSNSPTAWQWTFEGAVPASATVADPANVCYDLPGVYDVTLITTSANGNDTLYLPDYITVNATPPFPTITQNGNTLTSSPADFYQWQFNTVDIPGATNQSYTITQSGLYTVIVFDQNGCKNSETDNFIVTGIEEEYFEEEILIYPNPSSGTFIIEWPKKTGAEDLSLIVINALGQVVFSSVEKFSPMHSKWQINLGNCTPGIYCIKLSTSTNLMKKKIVIAD